MAALATGDGHDHDAATTKEAGEEWEMGARAKGEGRRRWQRRRRLMCSYWRWQPKPGDLEKREQALEREVPAVRKAGREGAPGADERKGQASRPLAAARAPKHHKHIRVCTSFFGNKKTSSNESKSSSTVSAPPRPHTFFLASRRVAL
jgi:hypothetical protein